MLLSPFQGFITHGLHAMARHRQHFRLRVVAALWRRFTMFAVQVDLVLDSFVGPLAPGRNELL